MKTVSRGFSLGLFRPRENDGSERKIEAERAWKNDIDLSTNILPLDDRDWKARARARMLVAEYARVRAHSKKGQLVTEKRYGKCSCICVPLRIVNFFSRALLGGEKSKRYVKLKSGDRQFCATLSAGLSNCARQQFRQKCWRKSKYYFFFPFQNSFVSLGH